MGVYNGYLKNTDIELNSISNNYDKLDFLFREKNRFIEMGDDTPAAEAVRDWFNNKISQIKFQIERGERKKTAKSSEKTKLTYHWQGTDKDLPELLNEMADKWIISETTIEQFTDIFKDRPLDTVKPLIWHENNASEVLYFVLKLEEIGLIHKTGNRTDYKKLKTCFVHQNGTFNTVSFASLKQKLDINLSRTKQKAIDNLLEKHL